jgi:hypothetical protein
VQRAGFSQLQIPAGLAWEKKASGGGTLADCGFKRYYITVPAAMQLSAEFAVR